MPFNKQNTCATGYSYWWRTAQTVAGVSLYIIRAGDASQKLRRLGRELRDLRGKTRLPVAAAAACYVRQDTERPDKVRWGCCFMALCKVFFWEDIFTKMPIVCNCVEFLVLVAAFVLGVLWGGRLDAND
jgi:hypothetical protein